MTRLAVLFTLTAAALSGCLSSDPSQEDLNLGLVATPATVSLDQETLITVSGGESLKTANWQVTDEDGTDVSSSCTPTGSLLTCHFETAGAKAITLTGVTMNGSPVMLSGSVDVLDPASPKNQAPLIRLSIKDSGGTVLNRVGTLSTDQSGASDFETSQALTFDFSATTDDADPVSALKIELDIGSGLSPVAVSSSQSIAQVGIYPATIRVTDTDGNVTVKAFMITIHCRASDFAPLTANSSQVAITSDPVLNFFLFNATGAVTGGKGPYQYSWDFNGDEVFDNDWTASTSTRAYTIYSGSRSVALKVWDTGCNHFARVNVPYNFVIPRADAVPGNAQGPQIPGYYFLQSKIRPLSGTSGAYAKTQTADVITTQSNSAPSSEPKRVLCDYRKSSSSTSASGGSNQATFHMTGLNGYDRPGKAGVKHGMEIQVTGIVDPTGMTAGGAVDTSQAKLSRVNYFTDEGADTVSKATYGATSGCALQLTVTPLPAGPGTCATTPSFGYPVRIDGTFSCPTLKGTNQENVSATEGAFYCEVARVDACPPGGGGGGGGLPPIPR